MNPNQRKATALGATFALFIIAIGVWPRAPQPDDDLCLAGVPIAQAYSVILDFTDTPTEMVKTAAAATLRFIQQSAALHGRVSVYVLAGDERGAPTLVRAFHTCRPNDLTDYDQLTQGEQHVKAVWDAQWIAPMEGVIEKLEQYVANVNGSPLMATLEAVIEAGKDSERHSIVYLTDGREYSSRWSDYPAGKSATPTIEPLAKPAGVQVTLNFYQQPSMRVRNAWQQFLTENDNQPLLVLPKTVAPYAEIAVQTADPARAKGLAQATTASH